MRISDWSSDVCSSDLGLQMSDGYGKHTSGFGITREQSIDLIVQACLDTDITDTRQIAYVLATAQHESGNFRSPQDDWGRKQAVTLAYHGGEAYSGRGYATLPPHDNYPNTRGPPG